MSTGFSKFEPRPGIVNKQGHLPDPSELVCVEIPKVFDQCLIKKCLVYAQGEDTKKTDSELRSDTLINPQKYTGSRDFNIKITSIDKISMKKKEGFKKIIISYIISFYADYIDKDNVNRTELFEINRTDSIGKFYCPDSVVKQPSNPDSYSDTIKLEMVADVLEGKLTECDENLVLDITLGYYIVVKSELTVQLLIPAYNYNPVLEDPCEEDPEEDPCEEFNNAPMPNFYPAQNMNPLFTDFEESNENE